MKTKVKKIITADRIMTTEQKRRWVYGSIAIERAYAKLNLGLKVLNKRDDGFHNLDMLNCEIDIFDDIICYETKMPLEIITNVDICKQEDNLVYKVAKMIIEKYNIKKSVKIEIIKRIPFGAGLAGGSADAAATIRALNRLWKLKMSTKDMLDIASVIGSDVSYLVEGGFARVQGVGNQMEFINSDMRFYVVLVTPNYKSYTKDVFNNHKINNTPCNIGELTKTCKINDYDRFQELLYNDLQITVSNSAKNSNQVTPDEIAQSLIEFGCDNAVMTGSGSSVFGINQDVLETKIVANKIKEKYPNYDVVFTKLLVEKPSIEDLEEAFYHKEMSVINFLR